MSFKQYLTLMIIGAITSWAAFIFVLIFINPETTSGLGFALFYLCLFFALTISFALFGYFLRSLRRRANPLSWQVNTAFRQGTFFAFLVASSLFLLSHNLFSWLNLLLLIFILTFLEFFLISKKNNI